MKGIMKRILFVFVLTASVMLFLLTPALAAESGSLLWNEEYYRAHDSAKELSDPERDELDRLCIDFMTGHELDLVLLSVLPEEYEGSSLEELAGEYYTDYQCGYGSAKSGIAFICDETSGEAEYVSFGSAEGLVESSYLEFAAASSLEFYSMNGIYGVLYSGGKFIANYFEGIRADTFLQRVVDRADIFSDQEEQELKSRIYEVLYETGSDIVVVTDTDSHGKTKTAYADEFFDDGGYGGDGGEGACLFICMDPEDRGFWVSLRGTKIRRAYTEAIANEMDAVLQDFLKEGRYADGVSDWLENLSRLLTTGEPFRPAWLSEAGDSTERFHDPRAARVDDAAHVLTAEERLALSEKAQTIARENDLDVVVHIARDPGGDIGIREYAERYWRHMGYGYGEDFDGIALISLTRYGEKYETLVYTSGSGGKRLTVVNEKRLVGFYEVELGASKGDYNRAIGLYLDKLKAMEKSGRVPRSLAYWIFIVIAGLILGLVFSVISTNRAVDNMETVKVKSSADVYLLPGSLRVDGINRYYNTTKNRRYSPAAKRSGSSGSGSGRSSYSGGHRSSSGHTHSGSGRSF